MADLITKLNYIKETKDLIMQSLIDQGQEISSDTPFRNYAPTIEDMPVGCKLFETIQDMNNDDNPKEGDLALVYRQELQAITGDTEFSICEFPNTVILDEAFVGDTVYCSFRSIDSEIYYMGDASLNASSFSFRSYGEEMIQISYTSSDGITYTRTDGGAQIINLETAIKYDSYGTPFDNRFGKFMHAAGMYFDGLYKCDRWIDKDEIKFPLISGLTITGVTGNNTGNITFDGTSWSDIYNLKTIQEICLDIIDNIVSTYGHYTYENYIRAYVLEDNSIGILTMFKSNQAGSSPEQSCVQIWLNEEDTTTKLHTYPYNNGNTYITQLYKVNLTNKTFVKYEEHISDSSSDTTKYLNTPVKSLGVSMSFSNSEILSIRDLNVCSCRVYHPEDTSNPLWVVASTYGTYEDLPKDGFIEKLSYLRAETQFTLDNPNQIMPGIKAYGKNGEVEGDGSIYANISPSVLLGTYLGLPNNDISNDYYLDQNSYCGTVVDNSKVTYLKRSNTGKYLFGKKDLKFIPENFTGNKLTISDNGKYIINTITEAKKNQSGEIEVYKYDGTLIKNNITFTTNTTDNNYYVNGIVTIYKDYLIYLDGNDIKRLNLTITNPTSEVIAQGIITYVMYDHKEIILDRYYIHTETNKPLYIVDLEAGQIIYTLDNTYKDASGKGMALCIDGKDNIYVVTINSEYKYSLLSIAKATGTVSLLVNKATLSISDYLSRYGQFYTSIVYEDNNYIYTYAWFSNSSNSGIIRFSKTNGSIQKMSVNSVEGTSVTNISNIHASKTYNILWLQPLSSPWQIRACTVDSISGSTITLQIEHTIGGDVDGNSSTFGNIGYHYYNKEFATVMGERCSLYNFDYDSTNHTYTINLFGNNYGFLVTSNANGRYDL